MCIFCVSLIAFSNAFYLIGRDQRSLSNDDPERVPDYSTLVGAFHHVFLSSLGDFDTQFYFDNEMSPILALLFVSLSFFMCIHLLNMLIAIMGESFSKNNKRAMADIKKSQLAFVVDNWWINPISRSDKIIYLVAAFAIQDDRDFEDEDKQTERDSKVDKLTQMLGSVMNDMREVKQAVGEVQKMKKEMSRMTVKLESIRKKASRYMI